MILKFIWNGVVWSESKKTQITMKRDKFYQILKQYKSTATAIKEKYHWGRNG